MVLGCGCGGFKANISQFIERQCLVTPLPATERCQTVRNTVKLYDYTLITMLYSTLSTSKCNAMQG